MDRKKGKYKGILSECKGFCPSVRDFVRVVKELDLRPNALLARGFEPHRSQKGAVPPWTPHAADAFGDIYAFAARGVRGVSHLPIAQW